jgi:hypothetical protein
LPPEYAEYKPYLVPFDAVVFSATTSSDLDRAEVVIVAR